jgi:hypothetical protein
MHDRILYNKICPSFGSTVHDRILHKMSSYRVYSARPYSTKNVLLFTVDGRIYCNVLLSGLQCTTIFYSTKNILLSGLQCTTLFFKKELHRVYSPRQYSFLNVLLSSLQCTTAVFYKNVLSDLQCTAVPIVLWKMSSSRVYGAGTYST